MNPIVGPANPTILDESLLIIAHEYDGFEREGRLDLLAVHAEGDLVVIELKRDASGSQVDFQAMKYCSYCATLTPKDIVEIYQEYIKKFGLKQNAPAAGDPCVLSFDRGDAAGQGLPGNAVKSQATMCGGIRRAGYPVQTVLS